ALTIGLSIVSRSITDVSITGQEQESARAFSVAEAGLESLLAGGAEGVSFEGFDIVTETLELGNAVSFAFPKKITAGDAQTVWLVSHVDEDTLDTDFNHTRTYFDLYWGNEGQSADEDATPALEATLYYSDGDYKTLKAVYDPRASRRNSNNFAAASSGSYSVSGKNLSFYARMSGLPSADDMYLLRLKLIYNDSAQEMAVASDEVLPLQGNCFTSTATSQETGIARRVQQCKLFKSLPSIFDYVLYSAGGLIK
ncbi:MAG: hypothetical protein ABIH88_02270, partial [Patescibacteria group bacterium]